MSSDEILNINQVAKYIGIHKITLYRLIKAQKIPAFKIGRQWRFKKKLLDKWIEENTTKKSDPLPTNRDPE
jgi:excisionase family DNA binding protein